MIIKDQNNLQQGSRQNFCVNGLRKYMFSLNFDKQSYLYIERVQNYGLANSLRRAVNRYFDDCTSATIINTFPYLMWPS